MRGLIVGLSLAAAAVGQPVGHGFGSVVFPGTGVPRVSNPIPPGHIQALGATIRGVPPRGNYGGGNHGSNPGYVFPFVYPAMPYASAVAGPVPVPIPASAPAPTVIINNNYVAERANPVVRDYSNEALPETPSGIRTYQAPIPNNAEGRPIRRVTDDKPTVYLLALHDGTVLSCLAFWREKDEVYVVTTKQVHRKVGRDQVDRALSEQLNRERGVDFDLE
jgi:hypothetical protein